MTPCFAAACLCAGVFAAAASPNTDASGNGFEHGFDSVNGMMHGWLGLPAAPSTLEFYAKTYDLIVMGSGSPIDFTNETQVREWDLWKIPSVLRALNPNVKILLYENIDWGILGLGPSDLQAHPEWWLRDDHGVPYLDATGKPRTLDYRIPEARLWWAEMVTRSQVPNATLHTLFDGLLVDGAMAVLHLPVNDVNHSMSAENIKLLTASREVMISEARTFYHALNGGSVVGNPLLDWGEVGFPAREEQLLFPMNYHWQFLDGALDEMFGGFSSLEGAQGFGNQTGLWNASTMNISMTAVLNMSSQGKTVLIRGYPGPCNVPLEAVPVTGGAVVVPQWPDLYPMKRPTTVEGLREVAGSWEIIKQALAPYLIVASENVWWSYAWFYQMTSGWYPCPDDSCLGPKQWYPVFANKVGAPLGPPTCDRYKWTRAFTNCTVSVDLQNPSASTITFH